MTSDWRPPREVTNASAERPLMNIDQLCVYLDVSKAWVYKKVERGEIPFFRAGGIRFSRSQIAAWLNSQQAERK